MMKEDKIVFALFKEHRFGFEIELDLLSRDVSDWSGVLLAY